MTKPVGRGFTLDIMEKGSGKAAGRLDRLADHAEHSAAFFQMVGDLLIEQSRRRWRNNGPGWKGLADSTKARKRRQGLDPRVMRATGALERALTVWGAPGQKWEHGDGKAEFGIYVGGAKGGTAFRVADVYYGAFAQAGKGEAQRVIVRATPATRKRVLETLSDYLLGMEGGASA